MHTIPALPPGRGELGGLLLPLDNDRLFVANDFTAHYNLHQFLSLVGDATTLKMVQGGQPAKGLGECLTCVF